MLLASCSLASAVSNSTLARGKHQQQELSWCLCCRSSEDDSDEGELDMEDEQPEEQDEAPQEQQAAPPHSSSGISAVNGPSPVLRGSPRGDSPQGGSPRANSSNNRSFEPLRAPEMELELDTAHSLEEALLKQMDMQKKLHEQLEVRVGLCILFNVVGEKAVNILIYQCLCTILGQHCNLSFIQHVKRGHFLAAQCMLKTYKY